MGMDISGKDPNPKVLDEEGAPVGEYFRNNCWWWRPLWNYCAQIAPDLINEEVYERGQYNDGKGLNSKEARILGERLIKKYEDGSAKHYKEERILTLEALPLETCEYCNDNNRGKNKRKECNPCGQTGKRANWQLSYPFDERNVHDFGKFCVESGGFEIW